MRSHAVTVRVAARSHPTLSPPSALRSLLPAPLGKRQVHRHPIPQCPGAPSDQIPDQLNTLLPSPSVPRPAQDKGVRAAKATEHGEHRWLWHRTGGEPLHLGCIACLGPRVTVKNANYQVPVVQPRKQNGPECADPALLCPWLPWPFAVSVRGRPPDTCNLPTPLRKSEAAGRPADRRCDSRVWPVPPRPAFGERAPADRIPRTEAPR